MAVDPLTGMTASAARELVSRAGFPAEVREAAAEVLVSLWRVMVEEDALLVEVNPLAWTAGGAILALDGKVSLDEGAALPPRARGATAGPRQRDGRWSPAARAKGLNYVKLDGHVGVVGNGAGLVM